MIGVTRAGMRILTIFGAFALVVALSVTALNGTSAIADPEQPDLDQVPVGAVVGFNPGMIISDEIFYNPNTMDANSIQNFLNRVGANCVPGTDNQGSDQVTVPCLKDYAQATPDREADAYCRAAYQGAPGESAATILAKVSQACGINPQVLMVTLQKEQSLLTMSGANLKLSRYQKAMGYACPDTAECDSKYFGFFNQVYSAAHRFQYYRLHPEKFRHRAGKVNDLLYHPKRNDDGQTYKCGTVKVFIANQATAGLYNYTPYTPNAAALAAGGGLGDECSSYGNRNFFRFFTAWFGSTGSATGFPVLRLAGSTRIETAAAISARAYSGGSQRAYIARSDGPIDSLAGGSLTDGPVLLVPPSGAVPQAVRAELNRLGATEVVALGGRGAIPDSVLQDAAQGRQTSRVFGPDRYSTAIAIANVSFPNGARRVYIADGVGADRSGSPDAVVGGILTDGPVLLIDPNNPASWDLVASAVEKLDPRQVVALGGSSVVPDQALKRISASRATGRLAGATRYDTAVAIASYAFPTDAGTDQKGNPRPTPDNRVVYLANATNFVDALVAGALRDGPVLLVPGRTDHLNDDTHNYLAHYHPTTLLPLGGEGAVSSETVEAAAHSVRAGNL